MKNEMSKTNKAEKKYLLEEFDDYKIKIAVVILNWNGKDYLQKFLPHWRLIPVNLL